LLHRNLSHKLFLRKNLRRGRNKRLMLSKKLRRLKRQRKQMKKTPTLKRIRNGLVIIMMAQRPMDLRMDTQKLTLEN